MRTAPRTLVLDTRMYMCDSSSSSSAHQSSFCNMTLFGIGVHSCASSHDANGGMSWIEEDHGWFEELGKEIPPPEQGAKVLTSS
jgi:hypothetical protein